MDTRGLLIIVSTLSAVFFGALITMSHDSNISFKNYSIGYVELDKRDFKIELKEITINSSEYYITGVGNKYIPGALNIRSEVTGTFRVYIGIVNSNLLKSIFDDLTIVVRAASNFSANATGVEESSPVTVLTLDESEGNFLITTVKDRYYPFSFEIYYGSKGILSSSTEKIPIIIEVIVKKV